MWIPQPEYCPSLLAILPALAPQLWHTFRPDALAFQLAGINVQETMAPGPFDWALCVPTRQRVESLGHIAHAWLNLKPEGTLLFACANDQGARGYLTHLKEVFPGLEAESSRKCRYALLRPSHIEHPEVLQRWRQATLPQTVPGTDLVGVPGIFGWNKIDHGSEILMEVLPPLKGRGADFGSGYGYLSHELLRRSPEVSELHLVEAEARALECARHNLREFAPKTHYHWWDATREVNLGPLDWVVMNPPFHEGHETTPQLGQRFIEAAARVLKHGGDLYLVANKFLGYEDVIDRHFKSKSRLIEKDGFKVIHARR